MSNGWNKTRLSAQNGMYVIFGTIKKKQDKQTKNKTKTKQNKQKTTTKETNYRWMAHWLQFLHYSSTRFYGTEITLYSHVSS